MIDQAFPLWIWVDTSRACNLACKFCYSKVSHGDEHLGVEEFQKYLDTLLACEDILIQKMNLNWRGDPLMNPALPDLLSEIDSRNVDFPYEFHTNGVLMTRQDAENIVSSMNGGKVFVSIDGGTERGHDFNRGRGTFRGALQAARFLLEARGDRPTPELGIYQLDLGDSEADYDDEFVDLVGQVDEWVRIDPVHPKSGLRVKAKEHRPAMHKKKSDEKDFRSQSLPVVPQDRWWSLEVPEDTSVPRGACFWAGNSIFIAPNGDVSVCLLSYSSDGVLGNLRSDSISSLIANAREFREQIEQRGRVCVAHCQKCRMAEGVPHPIRLTRRDAEEL